MFLKSTKKPTSSSPVTPAQPKKLIPSVISADMSILGNIISDGIVDFDGTIDGNVKCATLVLRPNGRVNGEIKAETVQIYGKVKGLIKAKAVNLYATCHVEGVIMHETISIEDGATIDGKFKRTTRASAAAIQDEQQDESDNNTTDTAASAPAGKLATPRLLDNIRLIAG